MYANITTATVRIKVFRVNTIKWILSIDKNLRCLANSQVTSDTVLGKRGESAEFRVNQRKIKYRFERLAGFLLAWIWVERFSWRRRHQIHCD